MSDSDDDYMSDKLLTQCTEDVRPGLLFSQKAKREHDLYKKKEELQAKRPKTQHEVEKELRDKGLNTAISSENKGFKMLEKMGFKPGQSLGKRNEGLKEPIKIEVKQGTSGVGRERHIKEVIKKKTELKEMKINDKMNEFKFFGRVKTFKHFLSQDMRKAQKTCEELDYRKDIKDPIEEFFWTRQTMLKRKNFETEEEEEQFVEDFDEYTTEENLSNIISYLRENYLYCIYCGFVANDEEDLKNSCPGSSRADHDDD